MRYMLRPFDENEFREVTPYTANNGVSEEKGNFFCRLDRDRYIESVNKLLTHIKRGDIYEINYCIEFFATGIVIDCVKVYERLKELTNAPFAGLYQCGDSVILCASPERFIKKTGNMLISQPMKGTARRGSTAEEDARMKHDLQSSLKEQTENVMALDVTRNDLSRIAKKSTVKTTELFGVHTFKNVHQMISTAQCELKENISLKEIMHAVFPPPSMTGAPKISACDLIKKYEVSPRGFYSGCLGWTDEKGDFDFCVLIRTIICYPSEKRLSFHVGSAITAAADPAQEWDECLLKASAMLQALGVNPGDVTYLK